MQGEQRLIFGRDECAEELVFPESRGNNIWGKVANISLINTPPLRRTDLGPRQCSLARKYFVASMRYVKITLPFCSRTTTRREGNKVTFLCLSFLSNMWLCDEFVPPRSRGEYRERFPPLLQAPEGMIDATIISPSHRLLWMMAILVWPLS